MSNLRLIMKFWIDSKHVTYRSVSKEIQIPIATLYRYVNNKEIEAHSLNKILLWLLK